MLRQVPETCWAPRLGGDGEGRSRDWQMPEHVGDPFFYQTKCSENLP